MTLFRDRGVVLRTIRLGEADRIVTLMTEQHGKVRAVAKGVRRTTSKFGSRLEPLSHVALLGWQGRGDLDIVNQVEVIDTFRPVREDLDRMARGHVHARGGRPDRPGAARQPPPLRDAGRGPRRPGRAQLADGGPRLLPQGAGPRGVGPGARRLRVLRRGGRRAAGGLRPGRGRGPVPAAAGGAGRCPPTAWPCCAAPWAAGWPACWPSPARRSPTRSPPWPPRPWRPTSTAGCAPCARARCRDPGAEIRPDRPELRGLRPRPVLPVALRLLRLRHLHRPRPPDGGLRRRPACAEIGRAATTRGCPRPPRSSSGAGPRRGCRPTCWSAILDAVPRAPTAPR